LCSCVQRHPIKPMPPAQRFPLHIKSGSIVVRVYRLTRADGRTMFTTAWTVGGRRHTRQFSDLAAARHEAQLRADQLAAGKIEVAAGITGDDIATLAEARRITGDTPILDALATWAKAREMVGDDILAACEHWRARTDANGAQMGMTVAQIVKRFLTYKTKEQRVDTKAGYDRTLPALVDAIGDLPIGSVTPETLSNYLSRFENAGSYNSHRKRIVALWRWARKRGFLPLDVMTAAERTDSRKHRVEIGLVTPEQLRAAFALIAEKAPHYLPALTLAALCGMRRAEVHGQQWEDVELGRRFVRVSAAKPNTPARRLIPLGDAAIAWLLPHRQKKGPICDNLAVDRIRDICRTAGLDLAENGFRHSWISARVHVTGDVNGTSLEAGNTPRVLHQHYRELMDDDEARAWFEVTPAGGSGIITMQAEVAHG